MALGLYAVVGVGGVYVATATVHHRGVIAVRMLVAPLGVTVFLLLAATIPISNWSAGPTIATTAFVLAIALSTFQFAFTSKISR